MSFLAWTRDLRGRRVAAALVDLAPVLLLAAPLAGGLRIPSWRILLAMGAFLGVYLSVLFTQLGARGVTAGLQLVGLRVVDECESLPLGNRRILGRALVLLRLWATPLGVVLFLRSLDTTGSSWPDLASRSAVIPDPGAIASGAGPSTETAPRREEANPLRAARLRRGGVRFDVDAQGLHVVSRGRHRVVVARPDGTSRVCVPGRREGVDTGDRVYVDGRQVLHVGS